MAGVKGMNEVILTVHRRTQLDRHRLAAMAPLRQHSPHHAGPARVALAHSCLARIRDLGIGRRFRHGRVGICRPLARQAANVSGIFVDHLVVLAGLPHHGRRVRQQSGLLRLVALPTQLWLVFSGAARVWRIRSGERYRRPMVVRNSGGRKYCEACIAALGAAGVDGIRCLQSSVDANDIRLGGALARTAPHPRDHGRSVCSADAEFSIDRTVDRTLRQARATRSTAIRRSSCSGTGHSSSRPCRRRHRARHLSAMASGPQLVGAAVCFCDGDRLRPARETAGTISRRELERGRCRIRSSEGSAAPPGMESSRIRSAGGNGLRKRNPLSAAQRPHVAHPDHADFYAPRLPFRCHELRPAFRRAF